MYCRLYCILYCKLYLGTKKIDRKLRLPYFYHICQIKRQNFFSKLVCIGLAQDLKLALIKIELSLGKYKKNIFLVISTLIL